MKQRVLARSPSSRWRRTWLGARLASILTAVILALGAGGAVALVGTVDSHSNTYGGASAAMNAPHKQQCKPNSVGPSRCHVKHSVKAVHKCKKHGKPHKCPAHHEKDKHGKK